MKKYDIFYNSSDEYEKQQAEEWITGYLGEARVERK